MPVLNRVDRWRRGCAWLPLVWAAADAVRVRTGPAEELEDHVEYTMRLMPRPESIESMQPTLREPDPMPYKLRYPDATSYSQWRQDITLAPIFQSIGDKGFFVEAGAYNGETHSNTLLLEKRGWSGLLIEPESHKLASLKTKHRKAHVFEGALSPTGARELVRFGGTAIVPDDSKKAAVDVIAEPLHSLMHALGRKTVDFWSLDIEGSEGPVLNSTDFRSIEVGVLLIEVNHKKELAEQVMAREGFRFIGNTHYQTSGTEIKDASPDTPWRVLDDVYINPRYFERRSLPVPKRVNENLRLYDCGAAAVRKERGLAAFKGDAALLKSGCH